MIDFEEFLESFYYNVSSLKKYFSLYKLIKINYKKTNKYSYVFCTILSSLEKTFFVELAKLLDDREQRSLQSLIKISKKEINNFKSNDEINKSIEKLESILKNEELREKLKKYRDKYIAHNDKEYFINSQKIFKEYPIKNNVFEKVINIIFDEVSKIYYLYIPFIDLSNGKLKNQFNNLIK